MGKSSEAVSEPPGASAAAGSRTVFLSYASPDAAVANQVCEFLESHGVSCWMAPRDVKPGAAYADAIVRAINEASTLVLVLSGAAMASEHVSREVERAASKHKPVVAFRLDATALSAELEYFLSRSQWIDAPALGMSGALVKLVEAEGKGAAAAQVNPGLGDGGATGRSSIKQAVGTASVAKRVVVAAALVVVLGVGGVLAVRFWQSKHGENQAMGIAAISDKSIAVLPFADMSQKKDQEYFGDGMAEEILDLLAMIPNIKVIGRTSSFQYKGKNEDLRAIGAQLGAAYVLEGSVRKAGGRVRITAQLIGTQDGVHRWSETYERDVADVLKLQDEIAAGIARALEVTIGATDLRSRLILPNSEAYDAYLRGRHAFDRSDKDGFAEAADDFQHAIDSDPTFADAAAWLAITKMLQALWGYVPAVTAFEQVRRTAEMAVRLDPKLAIAHCALGEMHIVYDWDWVGADKELKQALALQPGLAVALFDSSELAASLGHWDDAVRLMNDSLVVDPFFPSAQFVLGNTRWRSNHLAEAEAAMRRGLQITPTYAGGHTGLAAVLLTRGQLDAALTEAQLESNDFGKSFGLALVYWGMRRTADANQALAALTTRFADVAAYDIAEIHAFRHENDQAFMWLDRAYAQKDAGLYEIKGDPLLKNLEGDPQYKVFLRKMNLPE